MDRVIRTTRGGRTVRNSGVTSLPAIAKEGAAHEAFAPTRGTKAPSGPDLDQAGAVAGAAILSFSSVQVLRTSAVISEQSSI